MTTISPRQFQAQLEIIQGMGLSCGTSRSVSYHDPILHDKVMITFDDGYEVIYEHAFPLLEELDFPATLFAISGYLGRNNTWDANLGGIRFRHANSNQLKDLQRHGWVIGSHTHTHRSMMGISRNLVRYELEYSKKYLEDVLGEEVVDLALPFDYSSRMIEETARELGYRYLYRQKRFLAYTSTLEVIPRHSMYSLDRKARFQARLENTHPRLQIAMEMIIHFCSGATIVYNTLK